MIEILPEIQIHSCAKINEKLNEVIDWINDVSALRVTDKQVTANLPNIDAGELAFLSKENTELKDEIDRLQTELERTRKALGIIKKEMSKETMPDFAVIHDALKTALEQKQPTFVHNKIEFPEFNDNLLEEFDKQFFENGQDDDLTETALEQKDVK